MAKLDHPSDEVQDNPVTLRGERLVEKSTPIATADIAAIGLSQKRVNVGNLAVKKKSQAISIVA
ncbi:MAG: hypothetical protein PHI06_07540 [Desulfobulbaceae bacterium]|nr:hypothetical protein [Desulfobulbaceae bacterium]